MKKASKKTKFPGKTEFRRSIRTIVDQNTLDLVPGDSACVTMIKSSLRTALEEFSQLCPGSTSKLSRQILSSLSEKRIVVMIIQQLFEATPSADQLHELASDLVHYANDLALYSCMIKPML